MRKIAFLIHKINNLAPSDFDWRYSINISYRKTKLSGYPYFNEQEKEKTGVYTVRIKDILNEEVFSFENVDIFRLHYIIFLTNFNTESLVPLVEKCVIPFDEVSFNLDQPLVVKAILKDIRREKDIIIINPEVKLMPHFIEQKNVSFFCSNEYDRMEISRISNDFKIITRINHHCLNNLNNESFILFFLFDDYKRDSKTIGLLAENLTEIDKRMVLVTSRKKTVTWAQNKFKQSPVFKRIQDYYLIKATNSFELKSTIFKNKTRSIAENKRARKNINLILEKKFNLNKYKFLHRDYYIHSDQKKDYDGYLIKTVSSDYYFVQYPNKYNIYVPFCCHKNALELYDSKLKRTNVFLSLKKLYCYDVKKSTITKMNNLPLWSSCVGKIYFNWLEKGNEPVFEHFHLKLYRMIYGDETEEMSFDQFRSVFVRINNNDRHVISSLFYASPKRKPLLGQGAPIKGI